MEEVLGGVWTGWPTRLHKLGRGVLRCSDPSAAAEHRQEFRQTLTEAAMGRLCGPAVLLPVLLLWAVCSVSDVQADVKLCGREFIRAVVYTCGGSRWRRISAPQDAQGFLAGAASSTEDFSDSLGSDLNRRDLNSICCQFGCKKSDLTLLC